MPARAPARGRPARDRARPADARGRRRHRARRRTRSSPAATHDTGSAVAAVPFRGRGVRLHQRRHLVARRRRGRRAGDQRRERSPRTSRTRAASAGTCRLLRNVTGLWLLHECRRAWARRGREYSFDELVALAEAAPPLRSLVDPNDPPSPSRATCRADPRVLRARPASPSPTARRDRALHPREPRAEARRDGRAGRRRHRRRARRAPRRRRRRAQRAALPLDGRGAGLAGARRARGGDA